ncbi:ATP-dependent RNA helicase-like protein 2 [Elsinoe fawcettii]|nr:ATP-dependent RNA helicase-like protein 2 [Elsinoe fawcettii]
MAKFVPRVRKQKALARQRSSTGETTSTQPIDTNTAELPVHDARREALRAELKSQRPTAKVNGKKAKRLEHYIETKLKKEANQELIKKLAQSQNEVDHSLFKSAKNLGRGKETKREGLKRALVLEERGLAGGRERALLYEERPSLNVAQLENSSDEGPELEQSTKSAISVKPGTISEGGLFGAGLKRPLDVDESGRPQIKKRKRRKLAASKVPTFHDLSQDLRTITDQSGEENSDTEEWAGFSDGNEAGLQGEESGSEDSESQVSDSRSLDDGDDSSSDEDVEDDSSASTPSTAGPSRSSLFKEWAEQQRNNTLGYIPASSTIEALESAQDRPRYQPKPYQAVNAPALGLLNVAPDKLASSALLNRSEDVQEARLKLPVVQEEQRIMEAIHNNRITIVCGATGSGKTTQVPQMMFESGYGSKIGDASASKTDDKRTKGIIGVTQPRRVAATSVANRVAVEMGDMKNRVGHQVRFDSAVGPSTAIKFMTDGILLREVASDFTLSRYSAIVIDEAHERSVNTDILIGLLSRIVDLREGLTKEKPNQYYPLKLVIMSATMRVEDFTRNTTLFRDGPPPIVQAEGRQYPVVNHFARQTKRDYLDEMYIKVSKGHRKLPKGGMLVFLTGQAEILTLMRRLQKAFATTSSQTFTKHSIPHSDSTEADDTFENDHRPHLKGEEDVDEDEIHGRSDDDEADFQIEEDQKSEAHQKVHILPLYSQLPAVEQAKVFASIPDGSRLIILATNVAETSLTIPGIRYVFDCGRAKEKQYANSTGVQTFEINWISKASAAQRAGRAGRTGPGHCYRLYSSAVYERDFAEYTVPEILRSPVENVALMVKGVDFPNVASFPFPTPPDRHALARAEQLLKYLGAIDRAGKITDTGRALANYPVNPRYGRMLLLASSHGLLAHTIALVCALAIPELLISENQVSPHLDAPESDDDDSDSDTGPSRPNADLSGATSEKLRAYKAAQSTLSRWDNKCDALKLLTAFVLCSDPDSLNSRCEDLYVREKGMREAIELRSQLVRIVQMNNPGVAESDLTKLKVLKDNERAKLKYILAAGFADQVAIRKDLLAGPEGMGEGRKPRRAIHVPYRTLTRSYETGARTDEAKRDVFVHPGSVLARFGTGEMPQFIIYNHLSRAAAKIVGDNSSTRTRMHPLTTVGGKQLLALMEGTELLEVGKPIGKVEILARAEDGRERRECWVGVSLKGESGRWEMGSRKERQVRVSGIWQTEKVLG